MEKLLVGLPKREHGADEDDRDNRDAGAVFGTPRADCVAMLCGWVVLGRAGGFAAVDVSLWWMGVITLVVVWMLVVMFGVRAVFRLGVIRRSFHSDLPIRELP